MKCARCGKKLTADKYKNRYGALVGPECIKKNDILVKDDTYKVEYRGKFVRLERFPGLQELRTETIAIFKQNFQDMEICADDFMRRSSSFWAERFETPAAEIANTHGNAIVLANQAAPEYSLG